MFFLAIVFLLLPSPVFGFQLNTTHPSSRSSVLNLVFVGLRYPRQAIFVKDTETARTKLFSLKPFNEVKEHVNILCVTLDRNEEGALFNHREGTPPVVVRNDFLKKIATQVGSAYKLVILDYIGSNTCAELSTIDKMSLIIVGRRRYVNDDDFVKGFLHELGHSLGLRDECIHCAKVETGYPNCAPTKELAKQWWGAYVGKVPTVDYVHGCCGTYDCLRPSIASLMNDTNKARDYGYVNEEYIRGEFERMASQVTSNK